MNKKAKVWYMKALEKNIAIEGRHLIKDFNPGGTATKVLKDVSLQIGIAAVGKIGAVGGSEFGK